MVSSRLLVAFAAAGVSACTVSGQIEQSAIDYNVAIASMANEVAFLNVIRSMHRMPRHYTAISQIQGNLTVEVGGELAATIPDGSSLVETRNSNEEIVTRILTDPANAYTPKVTGKITSDPNFTVAILATQEFYRGILRPLRNEAIALYLSQGWRDDMVAHLFFEGIQFQFEDGTVLYYENDLEDQAWRRLVDSLSLHVVVSPAAHKPIIKPADVSATELAQLYEVGLRVSSADDGYAIGTSSPPRVNIHLLGSLPAAGESAKPEVFAGRATSRICAAPTGACEPAACHCLAEYVEAANAKLAGGITVGSPADRDAPPVLQSIEDEDVDARRKDHSPLPARPADRSGGPVDVAVAPSVQSVSVVTRSADGIIYYIGEYLRKTSRDGRCGGFDEEREIYIEGDPLFRCARQRRGTRRRDVLVSAALGGERFYVGADEGGRSMQVLGLIEQLVNLNKKASELPTPTFIQVQ